MAKILNRQNMGYQANTIKNYVRWTTIEALKLEKRRDLEPEAYKAWLAEFESKQELR